MTTKSRSTKRRTKVPVIKQRAQALSKAEQKNVKAGYTGGVFVASGLFVAAGDVEGDNVRKPTSVQDGTSNTILRKAP